MSAPLGSHTPLPSRQDAPSTSSSSNPKKTVPIFVSIPSSLTYGVQANITWIGGATPYSLRVYAGDSGNLLDRFDGINATHFVWTPDIPSGTLVALQLIDALNALAELPDLIPIQSPSISSTNFRLIHQPRLNLSPLEVPNRAEVFRTPNQLYHTSKHLYAPQFLYLLDHPPLEYSPLHFPSSPQVFNTYNQLCYFSKHFGCPQVLHCLKSASLNFPNLPQVFLLKVFDHLHPNSYTLYVEPPQIVHIVNIYRLKSYEFCRPHDVRKFNHIFFDFCYLELSQV
ncbi:hypothetical protein GSI_08482 [Ganoderma sinense ZZ0214-1]|uniref:Uncharacterized protein n=1 Tax=Ganoderma sinense ZZ0214-1 TaxID=1077348 RepID=A0A2G8S4F8_9APHY|nr:hypothetical protein GSI_08482 [Ganoderma sinense ZZ0214-1]